MSSNGWIGVDLDGTLAHYDTFIGPEHIGAPVTAMVERVKIWLAAGYEVRVFTARMSAPNEIERAIVQNAIHKWTKKHIGKALLATCVKDYAMIELWDDRCVQVRPNTGEPVGESTRGLK